ncbi:universal stress protein [Streptomyces sp. XM83C]|jgi:nucleotide-binding universal stress UspA family protein|uniref:Universal stress protein n=1 Tax=Streptomyces thermocoprophilus TaxID=78356 RepID=A0ABV5VJU1_9ACTN|nr:universal stress protein [Streptomyces sp. XM83C]MCK1819760.1 universal stress protein [Streptomyces sp. XM83C]
MELPVIVGVDGSGPSLTATDWAADEAALRGLPLKVLYGSRWAYYEGPALAVDLGGPPAVVGADDIVDAAVRRARLRRPGLEVTADVAPDAAEELLVREGRNAALLVLGVSGRGAAAERVLGSVSLTVAGRADCAVVLVHGHDAGPEPPVPADERVVVGLGGGAEEGAVVRFAAEEARLRGVPLEVVRAWKRPAYVLLGHPLSGTEPDRAEETRAVEALEAVLAELPPELKVYGRTEEGPARRVLTAAAQDAGLLVVGARRRADQRTPHLGRVAHTVLHRSACPLAVVPHR